MPLQIFLTGISIKFYGSHHTHFTDFCLLGLGFEARLPRLDVVAVDSSESRSSRDFVDPGESRDSSATSERSSVICEAVSSSESSVSFKK